MESDNEAHSASVKIEALDEVLSESQAAPPSPQLTVQFLVAESGCGNLDLPPSPPPLPLVSESVEPEIHDVLSMEMPPHVHQITDEPPLKKRRNMHQKPDQSIEACKIEIETVPPVSGTAEIDTHGEEQMEAQQGSDTIVSTGQRGTITQDTLSDLSQRPSAHSPAVKRMTRGRPRRPPAADPVDEPIPTDSKDHFSPLLWMPHDEHRVSDASRESEAIITARSRYSDMQYYSQMDPYLQNLGLQHLVDILQSESKSINASLIAGLVERWRPETHTFHLPFGEMTVTLQDVSALWGLPIQGVPVGGISDPTDPDNITINLMLAELLGAEPDIRGNRGKSKYCLDKTKLRAMFARGLGRDSTQLEIERYTRGFVMDLFGSVMFADSNGDTIPIMYLELLRDLQPSSCRYNLGGAVLAHLYSNLCHGCKRKTKQIYGPILLLQHWSWSRLPVGVPEPNEDPWGEPDSGNRPAFGMKWYGRHSYKDNPHGKPIGIRLVRSQIQSLGETQVIWTPYHELYTERRLPQIVADDREMWFYKGPLVCFWIVEHHYPDRVLRQFDLPPFIPVDPDVPRSVIMSLHGIRHGNHWDRDWSEHFSEHYNKAANMSANLWQVSGVDAIQFQGDPLLRYQAWYLRIGMASVYIEGDYGDFLRSRILDDDGYTPTGRKQARQLLLAIKGAARAIVCLGKRGFRAVGYAMLNLFAPCIEDHGHEAKLVTMLRDAGENIDWRAIRPDEPDAPLVLTSEMPPEPHGQPEWDYHHWVLQMAGWHAYRDEHGRPFLLSGPTYVPPPPEPHEQHESPEIQLAEDESLSFSLADEHRGRAPHTTR